MRTTPATLCQDDTAQLLTPPTWGQQLMRLHVLGLLIVAQAGQAPGSGER